jgi:short-subunit dehydrogenase
MKDLELQLQKSPHAQETLRELEEQGVTVSVFACDISDKNRLAAVLKDCEEKLPPIKGCIQASMVLKDKMFENMSYEEFRAATKPKVQGSWNLMLCSRETWSSSSCFPR